MGKRKANLKGEYNDFLDGEKLTDNSGIRTSLQEPPKSLAREVSPPPGRSEGGVSVFVTASASTSAAGPETLAQAELEAKSPASTANKPPKKPPLTHFLCIPLVRPETRPQLQEALERLALEVEEKELISKKAVRPVGTLHLTLAVMSLDAEGLERAGSVLEELDLRSLIPSTEGIDASHSNVRGKGEEEDATPASSGIPEGVSSTTTMSNSPYLPTPPTTTVNTSSQNQAALIFLNLKSLVPMQTPAKTSILYAQPHDPTARLYPFASAVRNAFSAKDLIVEETRPLKLHATVFNTIYAKGGRGGAKGRGGKGKRGKDKSWMKVDARELVDGWRDFVWAEGVEVDRVCICKMGAKKVWSGGSEGEGDVVDEVYEVVFERRI